MTHAAETPRRFRVYARHIDHHHARTLEESSFEAAAVAYLESIELQAAIDGAQDMSVIVHELSTGHEHCFRVDLDSGATSPCG